MRFVRHSWVCWALLLSALRAGSAEPTALQPWWEAADHPGQAAVEEKLLEYTNLERKKAGQPPLTFNEQLRTAARQHSAEMLAEGYFNHTSPHRTWARPADRAYRAGYWEAFVAENIVYMEANYDLDPAELPDTFMYGEYGWMNSPGHKANILSGDYRELGIGVMVKGGKAYATQLFGQRYFDFESLELERVGDQYELSGRAKLIDQTDKIYVAVDGEILERIAVVEGQHFRFKVLLSKGARHIVSLNPAKSARSYWVRKVFFLDAANPPSHALIMPFEE